MGKNIYLCENIFSVRVDGCGCYAVYSGRRGRGTETRVTAAMGDADTDMLGFSRVRSVARISCGAARRPALIFHG